MGKAPEQLLAPPFMIQGSADRRWKSGRLLKKVRWLIPVLTLWFVVVNNCLAAPDLSRFEQVFGDEFNGSQLDANKWNTGLSWGPYQPINNEEQLYVDSLGMHQNFPFSPFEMTGTSLKIVATEVTDELRPPPRPAEDDPVWGQYGEYRFNGPTADSAGYLESDVNYLSGIISSYDSFRFTHGYVETRVKLPAGRGLWPAFWALTSFYVEDVPEIDVMEFLGQWSSPSLIDTST